MPGCKPGDRAIILPVPGNNPTSPLNANVGRFVYVENRCYVEDVLEDGIAFYITPMDGKPLICRYSHNDKIGETMHGVHLDKYLQPIKPQKQETKEIQETRKALSNRIDLIKMKWPAKQD